MGLCVVSWRGVSIVPGEVTGPVLRLDEPLSFWGGFDPTNGTIIDVHHPQRGHSVAGQIVVISGTRGSAGTPGCIAEAIRRDVGPLGFVVARPDVNLATGVAVANALYQRVCPILKLDGEAFALAGQQTRLTISGDQVAAA